MANIEKLLEGAEKIAEFINDHQGKVTFKSDRATYPQSLKDGAAALELKSQQIFRLQHSNTITSDDKIVFSVQGSFGHVIAGGAVDNDQPVMKNVFFTLDQNSDVFGTSADFNAVAGDPVGTGSSPRLPFFITGSFSSLGGGSCTFKATFEIDAAGSVSDLASGIISGDAVIDGIGTPNILTVTL